MIIIETPHRGKPTVYEVKNDQAIIDLANNMDFCFSDPQFADDTEIEAAKEWLGHDLSSIGFYTVDELKDHQGNADQEFAVKQFIDDNVKVNDVIESLENYAIDPEYTEKLLMVTLGLFQKYPYIFRSDEIWKYYNNNKKT